MQVKISLPEDLVERMDEAREDVPRSKFVQRAVESKLEPICAPPESTSSGPGGGTPASRGVSSAEAKARVVPRPKRGGK